MEKIKTKLANLVAAERLIMTAKKIFEKLEGFF